jgi:hypothetical protein
MKKIIVLIILVHLTLLSISQIHSDSITCIPNSKLRIAIKEIENCKITKEELQLTQKSVSILESRLDLKDSIIKGYMFKDSLWTLKSSNYEEMIDNIKKQLLNEKKISGIYSFKNKILKINKWLYGVGGLAIGVLVIIITK